MPLRPQHADDLIARIRAGDRAASEEFVRAHYEAVYRFLLHLTSRPDMAADFTQDTFQAAWQKLGEFDGRASLASWLHRIAYNKFIDAQRKLRRDRTLHEKLKFELRSNGDVVERCSVVAKDTSQQLYAAVQQLPDEQRTIIFLHYFEGLSLSETADVVEQAVGTVKWRLSVALRTLRSSLNTESVK